MSSIPELYFKYYKEYSEKYGKICLLFEIGSFFEIYSYVDEKIDKQVTNIVEISDLLNIIYTRRNKTLPPSRSNCYMAGYPTYCNVKYLPILLENNYTIVMYEQFGEAPNITRKINQIISKSTQTEYINSYDNNYIMCIFIEYNYYQNKHNYLLCISIIDYSTGVVKLYQKQFLDSSIKTVYENIYRINESIKPSELLFYQNDLIENDLYFLKRNLQNENCLTHFYDDKSINPNFYKVNYQNEFLQTIYEIESLLNPIEYLNLEYYQNCIVSFILLIHFTENHNNNIIKRLLKPDFMNDNKNLILYNDSIYQLNIFSHYKHSNISSLFDILCKYTTTNIGKRMLKEKLINPITDINILNKSYDAIESCLNMNYINQCNNILKKICDIERIQRCLIIGNIKPYEYYKLNDSYNNILELYNNINETLKEFINENDIDLLKQLIQKNNKIFNFDELCKYNNQNNIDSNIFNEGIYENIDTFQNELNSIYDFFKQESKKISNYIEKDSDLVKISNNERDGYFFETTFKRYKLIEYNLKDTYEIKKTNNNVKLFSKVLKNNSNKILYLKENIKKECKNKFCELMEEIYKDYNNIFNNIVKFIGNCDVIIGNSKMSLILNYNKPTIIEKNFSYVEYKDIRHPIIEYIHEDEKYIGNDISLNNEEENILLFGINSSGKSSLSKAVALNLI